jgi:hypothetical protein
LITTSKEITEMKRRKHLASVVLALIAALLVATGPAAAEATVTEYTGTSTLLGIDDWGTWTFPDGNIHVRGCVHVYYDDTTDDRLTGLIYPAVNADWDATGVGPMWGTIRIEPDIGGGFWEGTWTGMVHADKSFSIRGVGQGRGDFEGLKVSFTYEYSGPTIGTTSGRILDSHGE